MIINLGVEVTEDQWKAMLIIMQVLNIPFVESSREYPTLEDFEIDVENK